MRWPTVFVMAEGQRPHPGFPDRRCIQDEADHGPIGQDAEIVLGGPDLSPIGRVAGAATVFSSSVHWVKTGHKDTRHT